MAESTCEALGLLFASRANLEKANSFGFETCSYGWIQERYGVISRIQNNEKCGQNRTGVLSWTVQLYDTRFNAYCFNSSDLQINSCKPELMVTIPPSTVAPPPGTTLLPATPPGSTEQMEWSTVLVNVPTTAHHTSPTPLHTTLMATIKATTKKAPTTTMPKTTMPKMTTPEITTPEITTPEITTPWPTEELPKAPENQAARQSEKIVFGGLPTALLILALVFFLAAVVLAICYIKKYTTSSLFRKIKEEKENVEAKVFKETITTETPKEEDVTANGKEGQPQNTAVSTGNSVEAEV
ncbi:lymphatic vessel endothelial hyaluronic acid receptor 1 isoform X2 [Hyperolius riggenbachi]